MPDHFNVTVGHFHTDLYGHHFMVPDEIAMKFIEGDNRRVLCTVNSGRTIQSALMPSKKGWYILLNKKIRDELSIAEGDSISVRLEKDRSEYGMEVPAEFTEVMSQEEEAWDTFKKLSMGKQRSLLYLVCKVKNSDSRIRKALAIAQHLKENGIKLDYKKLNELIKYYNNLK